MQIAKVKITNFRTLSNNDFDFASLTAFIGPNGAGKSTILYALDWFFNGGDTPLTANDATYGHEDDPIEVRVTFNQLTDRDRKILGKYAPLGSREFTAWKVCYQGEVKLSANLKGNPLFNNIKNASKATEKKILYRELQEEHPELNLPDAGIARVIEENITRWEQEHPDSLESVSSDISTFFNGFSGGSTLRELFNFAFVKADYRASEESEDNRSTLLSSIIEHALNRKEADHQIQELFNTIRDKEQEIYDNTFGDQLDNLSTRLNQVINSYSLSRSVVVTPNAQELKPNKTNFKVTVKDGENGTPVDHQGHGFQRMLLISALQLLAESPTQGNEEQNNGVLCLAIEEPELYQHPIQAKAFAHILSSLSENAANNVQVMYVTHSPYFIQPYKYESIYRLTRKHQLDLSVSVGHADSRVVTDRLEQAGCAANIEARYGFTLAQNLSTGLFANVVILVEGSSDAAILESLSNNHYSSELNRRGIAIVDCGSKSNICFFHAILEQFNIPSVTVFDNDSGWEDRFNQKHNNRNLADAEIAKKRDNEGKCHAQSNRDLVSFFGIGQECSNIDYPAPQKYKMGKQHYIFIVDDTLEPFLEHNWEGWREECESAENELNLHNKKNAQCYALATENADFAKCPSFLRDIIESAITLNAENPC